MFLLNSLLVSDLDSKTYCVLKELDVNLVELFSPFFGYVFFAHIDLIQGSLNIHSNY